MKRDKLISLDGQALTNGQALIGGGGTTQCEDREENVSANYNLLGQDVDFVTHSMKSKPGPGLNSRHVCNNNLFWVLG